MIGLLELAAIWVVLVAALVLGLRLYLWWIES